MKFGFDNGQAVCEKIFEYCGNIHVYCPGVGIDQPPLYRVYKTSSREFKRHGQSILPISEYPSFNDGNRK